MPAAPLHRVHFIVPPSGLLGWCILIPVQSFLSPGAQPTENLAEGTTEQGAAEGDEKKKRRGRKKSKLEDMFPAYLQVRAIWGNWLMDTLQISLDWTR